MLLYDLQMFAKDGPTGQKTEKPTAKKIKDSREEGQVAKSQDFSNAVSLLAVFVLMKVWVGHMGLDMLGSFQLAYNKIPDVWLFPLFLYQAEFSSLLRSLKSQCSQNLVN